MASEGMHSPVEQFEIKRFIEFSAGGYDISFTNSSLFMLLAMVVGGTFLTVAHVEARNGAGPPSGRRRDGV